MTLGERLRKYLPDGVEQKVVAMNWIARLEKAGMKPLSPSTAQSRLSELLASDPQGVRAFFRDPHRASHLFDELNVLEHDRDELRTLAQLILAGAPPAQLVADLSDLGDDRVTMHAAFDGVRDVLLDDNGIFPLAIVLTNAQYDLLPRYFDRFDDRMIVERVVDAFAGAEAVTRLAGDRACVVSRRPLVELSRWWALDVENARLMLVPVDGLARIHATGRVGVPEVIYPLACSATPAEAARASALTASLSGVARRRLLEELADEESGVSKQEPARRAAAAAALGVQATSTLRERIEAKISAVVASLDMQVRPGTETEWDSLVALASRRPMHSIALRVGDAVRVLNPSAAISPAEYLDVVRVSCAEPLLVTLEKAVAELTEDELLDDPLLGNLVHRLAGGDERALKLLFHARAVLVYGGRVRPRPATAVGDPLNVLRQIFNADVPTAQLRVRVDAAHHPFGSTRRSISLKPFVFPNGRIYWTAAKGSLLLYGTPPVGDVLLARGEKLNAAIPATGHEQRRFNEFYRSDDDWISAGRPSALVDPQADAERWLDDIDASPFCGGTAAENRWSAERHLPEPDGLHRWVIINEPDDLWVNADTKLALSWLALREALSSPRSIRMHDGAVLLQVGGGLAARVIVRRHGTTDSPVRGAIRCAAIYNVDFYTKQPQWTLGSLDAPITTYVAESGVYHTRVSVLLPSLWIAGRGYAVDVSFVPAPILLSDQPSRATLGAAAAGVVALADAAARDAEVQQTSDDDDDDDHHG